jgi:ferric-dicitrate binding protein FerR (iron transport regulator)
MNSPDEQPLGAFEEHLLAQLKTVVATRTAHSAAPVPARRPRRRLVLAGVAALAAAAAGTSVFALRTSPA